MAAAQSNPFVITRTSERIQRIRADANQSPSQVHFRVGRERTETEINARTGYAEAYEMQSRGNANHPSCIQCQGAQGPFRECRSFPEELFGACASCHFQQRAALCSLNAKRHDTGKNTPRKKKTRSDKGKKRTAPSSSPAPSSNGTAAAA